MTPDLILASGSTYRHELLTRLRYPFRVQSPDIDESVQRGETPLDTCMRLAREKAQAVARLNPDSIVIGSDQVADVNGVAISKPGNHENAQKQLAAMSGQRVVFHSAVCVTRHSTAQCEVFVVPTTVEFRELNAAEIERYLLAETPYDCAGSAKSEGLGIALLKRIESTDPTSIIGLPLIQLAATLRQFDLTLP
ncbi:Maf family nucleotide pyrophosphatase [Limnobacter humi]|uniref:7-methyl-GTP pyrophosphatase n=1 Tax=Limnobacter humi TaxID=1778671 RepID=A0ABT1WEF9_9BURK|nr:Maf family nucleotide pyrophosphatase [Limnobacter humi]MCQ8895918.1 Maf family nucleotide pyrophosphatase [Limnobacter humi]